MEILVLSSVPTMNTLSAPLQVAFHGNVGVTCNRDGNDLISQ